MGDRSMIIHSSAAAIVFFSTLWHATNVGACYYGRYGKYQNWPSVNDWEELLALLSGKYWDQGWGWKSPSYGSNSLGGGYSPASFGGGGYSPASFGGGGAGGFNSFSTGYKGASDDDGGNNYFSAPASQTGLKDGPASSGGSVIDTAKVKEALNSLFTGTSFSSSKKKKPTSTSSYGTGGSGGGIGQSFIDTPGPGYGAGPPKPKYKSRPVIDEPPLSYGPPYDDVPQVSGWPGGGSGGGSAPTSKPFSNNAIDPGLSNNYGPPYDHGPPDDPGHPYDHDPNNDHSPYHTDTKDRPAYDHYHGSSHDHGPGPAHEHGPPYNEQSHNDSPFDHHGPPRENHYSPYRSKGHRHKENQFQSDYDTFGGYDDRRRRQGRRRWSNNEPPAGSSTKPRVPVNRFKALRPRPPRRRMQRNRRLHSRHQRIARRKINTSFGGYKVDHSRIRYG